MCTVYVYIYMYMYVLCVCVCGCGEVAKTVSREEAKIIAEGGGRAKEEPHYNYKRFRKNVI